MAAAEKTLWVQVMEAGFGATLEAHGFRRVSPRLYRLEGDGIIWEQFTFRGPRGYLNTIREGHGAVVAGADELFRRAYGDRPQDFDIYPIRNRYCGRRYHGGPLTPLKPSQRGAGKRSGGALRRYDGMRRRRVARPEPAAAAVAFPVGSRGGSAQQGFVKIRPFQRQYAYDANFWCIGGDTLELGRLRTVRASRTDLEELAGLAEPVSGPRSYLDLRIGKQLSIYDRAGRRIQQTSDASVAGSMKIAPCSIIWPAATIWCVRMSHAIEYSR